MGGSVLIGGSVIEAESNGVRETLVCADGDGALEVRFLCSFRGGLEVVSRNAPPPKDVRRELELERWRMCALEDAVDLDHRLRLPP